MTHVVIPPSEIVFSMLSDDGERLELSVDVIESQLAFEECALQERPVQIVAAYQAWVKQRYNQDVSMAAAHTMINETAEAYDLFKKKLNNGRTSPTDTNSTPDS